ncbi:MAG: hypothetical protein IJC66_02585 [Kiritimatiellae bacterium]|nr:hypothetical protein [Kiritimatiellia bacterium]
MKKLMTILSVTAVAVFAVGAANGDPLNTGTGFETAAYVAGNDLDTGKDDAGNLAEVETKVWLEIADLESGVAVISNWNGEYEVADGNSQYLKLDSAPLISRYAQAGGTAVDIGDGLYIDTLVQFTAADPETPPTPDVDGGDKLCIWLADNEADPTQCTLMITAGFVNDDMGLSVVATNYATATKLENNSWHRLQVKALKEIDSEDTGALGDGFVVFIDGTAVATATCPINEEYVGDYVLNARAQRYMTANNYSIFPSLLRKGRPSAGEITALSFQGSGAVDNIAFTQGADIDPIEVTIPTAKLGLVADGTPKTGVTYDEDLEGVAFELDGDEPTQTLADNYTTTFKLFVGYAWIGGSTEDYNVDWSIASGSGTGDFDGGETGKTFTIDAATKTALEAKLPTGKTLSDVADAATGMTYAQAYALGLFNEETGGIEELNATIEFTAEGKVKVSLDVTTTYKVTLKVYEKASLTAEWPAEAKATYVLGSATEAAGFAPGSGSGSETSEFYKVAIAIENAD